MSICGGRLADQQAVVDVRGWGFYKTRGFETSHTPTARGSADISLLSYFIYTYIYMLYFLVLPVLAFV